MNRTNDWQEGYRQGWAEGHQQGRCDGKERTIQIIKLILDGQTALAERVAAEAERRGESNGPDVREGTFIIEE